MVLTPALQGAMYGLIFGVILGSKNRPDHFIEYLFCGVFLFTFLQGAFTNGATSVSGNAGLVKSLSFPRVLLPLSAAIQQLINLVPQLALLLFTLVVMGNPITVQFSDLNKVIPFAFRLIFYTSGIFYSLDKILAKHPGALAILKFNPFSAYIQLVRGILIQGNTSATPELWLLCAGWGILLPLLSMFLFWLVEERHGAED